MSQEKVRKMEIFSVHAGWRDWIYLRVYSSSGQFGLSEITESNGSVNALVAAIKQLFYLIKDEEYVNISEIVKLMKYSVRQSLPGILWKAMAGLENAIWDLVAKENGMSVYQLVTGLQKEKFNAPVYWSHCPTSRIRASSYIERFPVRNVEDLYTLGQEITELGFKCIKSNIFNFQMTPAIRMPGFAKNLEILRSEIDHHDIENFANNLQTLHESCPGVGIAIDLNYNLPSNLLNFFQQKIQDIPISWLEVDFDDFFEREKFLRIASNKICTGENLLGLDNYLQVIEDSRVEIISIDLIWNGFSEAIRIMEYATKFGKKIAIHNYYSSLASAMALNFYNIIPVNQRELLEFDFDDVPWRDFIIVNAPTYNNGMLNLDSKSGWGVELNQEIMRQHLKNYIILD